MNRAIATNWSGTYSYDPIRVVDDFLERPDVFTDTSFDLTLRVGWFGRFKGSMIDRPPGIPERAAVNGRISRNLIQFTKKYRAFWITDESGSLYKLDDQPPYVLYYEGKIENGGTQINGTWQIPQQTRIFDGQTCDFPVTTGTWIANQNPS